MATNSISVARSRTIRPLTAVRAASRPSLTPGQVARTLEDLIQMGFIEAFKDEHNVVRYRTCLVAKRRVA
jgi:hypothetical protein